MPKFVHLHGHTEYSLLDGLCKVPKLVKQAKELGMDALAITDHGVMYGAVEFYKSCVKEQIKPIVGCELYVAPRSHKHKEGKMDTEPFHLTVLAKNYQGYLNLMKLTTIAHLEGFYYKPRVDKELLKEHSEGLIVLSGCPGGEFIRSLDNDDLAKSEEIVQTYLGIFGEGNYFFELQAHPYGKFLEQATEELIRRDLEYMQKVQDKSWQVVKALSKKYGIPIVGTNDFHYIRQKDAEVQDAMLCVQTGKLISDINRLRMIDSPDYYLKSPDEMAEAFKEIPEALETSVKIADMINLEIPLGNPRFPLYEIPENKTAIEYLKELTYERAKKRMEMTPERVERLDYELSVIEKKNYATYFLVVSDFMHWANEQGIITNTRGSAAGSLVLYALGVTNIDPVFYMLPFERFLNPYRPSLPDIDADLADSRRDEVIRYVMHKYGEDKVGHIITYGTMMGRAAIRDVGRVMGMNYGEVDRIAKLVPPPMQGFHKTLEDALKEVVELNDLYRSDPQVKRLLDLAMQVEGTIRHASIHAAGIVIAPETITNFTPLQRESNGDKVVSQYDMFAVEDVGLVKMDFLGIRNLSILGSSVEYVKKSKGIDVDLKSIPIDDKKAFEVLAKGETMGLFQLEGEGMTKYIMELKPTTIFDISAMVALYRPGPLSIIPEYIARKRDPSKITYFDPRMQKALERSLGLLVYQDDVLFTAINLAGYNWEEVDKFRKAMGKKIPEEMAKQHDHFIEGCIQNGISREKAEDIFKLMEPFAKYGFNKAHAASYAMIAYQTAYMKANFPVEFMAAVMTAEYGDADKIARAMEECNRMGIVVLPTDVNRSSVGFSLEDINNLSKDEVGRQIGGGNSVKYEKAIRFGMSAIKNVGISAIESIIKGREQGAFTSLANLCTRVDNRLVNKKTLESLIKSGAMDLLGSRAAQLLVMDECVERAHQRTKNSLSGQVGLFGEAEKVDEIVVKLPDVEELPIEQLLAFEKDLLGFYLHEPLYIKQIKQAQKYCKYTLSSLSDDFVGQKIALSGFILDCKKVITKKTAAEMAFIKLSDGLVEVEAVVFPKTYDEVKTFLFKDKVVVVWGKVDKREDTLSIIVDKIIPFDSETFDPSIMAEFGRNGSASSEVEIMLPKDCAPDTLRMVNKTLREYPGRSKVSILLNNGGDDFRKMDLQFTVSYEDVLVRQLETLLGKGAVRYNG